jgi:xanthine dehydrogenase accessory factor
MVTAHALAAAALARGDAVVVVSPLDGPAAALVVSDAGERWGSLGSLVLDDAAAAIAVDALQSGSRLKSIGERRYFFDRHAPPTTLVIVGAGQIAISLTRFARELEMRTIVIDGRERYATRERFPDADDVLVGMPSEIVETLALTKRAAVILVAHDYKYELPILRQLLRKPVGYLGMLGSKKRGVAMRDILRDEGFADDEMARIHTPIGLDLGGKSSAEVALSILAEVVAVRSGKRA